MSPWILAVLSMAVGYLLGSISPAYLFGRLHLHHAGDLFAKVIGVLFGKRRLFKSRTIAGTLGSAGGSLAALRHFFNV